jgi:hypothetical protein
MLEHMRVAGLRQATPRNADPEVTPVPLLGLSSGYVQRSTHLFPKQGSRFPWQVHQSYLRDYRAMKLSGVVDAGMEYSNPIPRPVPAAARARAAQPQAASTSAR